MSDWLPIIAPAWIAGVLIALLSAPLGCLVLWRRMAFFSDTLAHGALLGIAFAVWLNLPADLGIGMISIAVIIALTLLKDKRLPNDATLAVLASTLLCLGLLTLTQLTQQPLKHLPKFRALTHYTNTYFLWGFWRDFVLWHFRRLAVY